MRSIGNPPWGVAKSAAATTQRPIRTWSGHRPETEAALASSHCRIFGRKTGFHPASAGGGHFPENALRAEPGTEMTVDAALRDRDDDELLAPAARQIALERYIRRRRVG